jgi:metal-dependent amidase/aminoacylase/carboxypeptidase family protein
MSELDGDVTLIGVPSEEPIELQWRHEQRKTGKLFFLGGKQEFIKAGKMDDVDICLIDHMGSDVEWKIAVRGEDKETVGGDGFMGKMITFRGVEAHSGGAPWNGVNALNAVALALMGIHSQRETFKDADAIRVHYVMTKGGDSLNVVPSEVRMELMVRGATVEAIKDACMKVDRAMKAGAMAVGAEVEIENIPGYLPTPRYGTPELARVLKVNAIDIVGKENVVSGMWRSPGGHSREYVMTDKYNAYIAPCKIYAGALIDLLWDGGKVAQKVLDEYEPVVAKDKYMDYWHDILGE